MRSGGLRVAAQPRDDFDSPRSGAMNIAPAFQGQLCGGYARFLLLITDDNLSTVFQDMFPRTARLTSALVIVPMKELPL